MCERDLLVIAHSGGQLIWDNGSPIYNGGCAKMAYLDSSITYSQLVQKICRLSDGNRPGHIPNIQYLHQNGRVCTLVTITNDDDVKIMFKASMGAASAAYLYIQASASDSAHHQVNEQRIASRQDLYQHDGHPGSRTDVHANLNNTLPFPKANPTNKGSGLGSKTTGVVKECILEQTYPSIDLGADFELPFSHERCSGGVENSSVNVDFESRPDIMNGSQHSLHLDEENCNGGHTCEGDGIFLAETQPWMGIDSDNLVAMHLDTETCREGGYTFGVEKQKSADGIGKLGNDSDTLELLHVTTGCCIEGLTVFRQGSSIHNEEGVENIHTRGASARCQDIPSVASEADINVSERNVNDNIQSEPEISNASKIADTMQAADELLTTPPHEESPHAMWKGRLFNNRDEFKSTLAKFAMYMNFCLKPLRTNRFEATARCKHPTCPSRIHASIVEAGPHFQVRTYNPEHNCSGPINGTNYPQATSSLIADFIKERLRVHQDYKPKEIMSDFKREFGVPISYRKAHIAKEMAMKDIRGSFEDSYNRLPDYRLELKRTNPGTFDYLWTEDDHSFQRYYVCFGGCARSFKSSLRPLVALDGTHLRGKYPGALLIAVCQDGDHGLFPLALAIVESECYATWSWFLACLDETLDHVHNLTIVSDRMKGLTNAVMDVLPSAKHCYCCRHISQNIQAKFKNDGIVMKFWCAARSTRVCEYEQYMAEIKSIDVGAHDYINAIGRQHWANAFIEGQRYDMLTTNIAESINSLLKDIRELPITQQIESIRAKLMEFYQKRREKGLNIKTRFTPYVDKILSHEAEASRRLQCWQAREFEFQVMSPEYTDVVHLDKKSCTCRKWDLLGIPCSHGLSAVTLKRYDPYDFCEQWFSSDFYRATYNDVIHATRDGKQWDHRSEERVLPPIARRQPGRPKKCRIRTEDRMRKQVTCSHCKKLGHNRQTCREPPPRG